jgi:hypothetical protein
MLRYVESIDTSSLVAKGNHDTCRGRQRPLTDSLQHDYIGQFKVISAELILVVG